MRINENEAAYRCDPEAVSIPSDEITIAGNPHPSAAIHVGHAAGRRNGIPIAPDEAQKMRALDALGLSAREIGRALKRGRETVRRVLAGETARQSGQGRIDPDGRLITQPVDPPVRCQTCRGLLCELPCRLCWQRGQRQRGASQGAAAA